MKIRTKYITNAKGTGQIVAKYDGRQRTIPWDHSASVDHNHGLAAGTLALALGVSWGPNMEKFATHETAEDGTHVFIL